jgi:hypothetical protein
MTSHASDWSPQIDFDSCEPIAMPPQCRSDTALPQEPFELPQPKLGQWFNTLLQFEDEPPGTQTQKAVVDWPHYYIVRALNPEKQLDITSDEPLPLKLTSYKPDTALLQTFRIPQLDSRGPSS